MRLIFFSPHPDDSLPPALRALPWLASGVAGELALAGRVRRREDRVGLLPGPTCRRRASCHLLPGPDRRPRRGVRACTRRTRGAALSPRRPVDGASARGAAAAYTPARR